MKSSYHARQRAKERLGFDLTPEMEEEIIQRIKSHKAIPTSENKEENTSKYTMTLKGKVAQVVYSWRTGKIVTVMGSKYLGFPK